MPYLRDYHIFISHSWKYKDDYYRFYNLIKDANNFKISNFSVPEHDRLDTRTDAELYAALEWQIRSTSIVVILAGMYVNHSFWIDKEIEIAKKYNKPIIGVKPWGNTFVPTKVVQASKEIVGWQTTSIIDAIRRYAL